MRGYVVASFFFKTYSNYHEYHRFETKKIRKNFFRISYPERDLNPHSCNSQRILSPSCPPFHHPGSLFRLNECGKHTILLKSGTKIALFSVFAKFYFILRVKKSLFCPLSSYLNPKSKNFGRSVIGAIPL